MTMVHYDDGRDERGGTTSKMMTKEMRGWNYLLDDDGRDERGVTTFQMTMVHYDNGRDERGGPTFKMTIE